MRDGEVYLVGAHISPYEQGNICNHDPLRPRKLLLHGNEIARLQQKINERGYTLVPTRMYFRGSRVKVEIALAHGKKQYDKRADLAARDAAARRRARAAPPRRRRRPLAARPRG